MILLCNKDPFRGPFNGARYMLKALHSNLPLLGSLTGDNADTILGLPKMPCDTGNSNLPIHGFTKIQFSVRVCYAINVGKVQEQSFNGAVGLVLSEMVFSHGQLDDGLWSATSRDYFKVCFTSILDK